MWIFTILLAIITAFLQSTVSPSLTVHGGAIDLILIVTLIFLFYGKVREACVSLLVSSIVLSILSGIALIYLISPTFLLIILYIFLSDRRIISKPSTLMSLPMLFIATILFELIKIAIMRSFSINYLVPIVVSSIMCAIVGGAIYWLCNKIYYFLNPQLMREKVKISNI